MCSILCPCDYQASAAWWELDELTLNSMDRTKLQYTAGNPTFEQKF